MGDFITLIETVTVEFLLSWPLWFFIGILLLLAAISKSAKLLIAEISCEARWQRLSALLLSICSFVFGFAILKGFVPQPSPDTLNTRDPAQLLTFGIGYLAQGKLEEAQTHLQKSLNIDSSNQNAWHSFGIVQHRLGNYSQAIQAYEAAIASPDLGIKLYALRNKGYTYQILGNSESALNAYNEVINSPESMSLRYADSQGSIVLKSTVLNDRGKLYEDFQKYDLAATSYAEAISIDQGNSYAVNNLTRLNQQGLTQQTVPYVVAPSAQSADSLFNLSTSP